MNSGTLHRMTWLASLLLTPGLLLAAEFDLHGLLERIAQPPAATIPFVEVRFSRLLKTPLAVAGQLERGPDGSLLRRVESPYRETTTIHGNDVTVLREGAQARTFSLERAPELQGLLESIGAMLRGDARALDARFTASLEGTPARWRVRLVPKDARLGRRLSDISVYGAESDTRCFAMNQPTGDASIIVLGTVTPADVPHTRRDELEAWCRGSARP